MRCVRDERARGRGRSQRAPARAAQAAGRPDGRAKRPRARRSNACATMCTFSGELARRWRATCFQRPRLQATATRRAFSQQCARPTSRASLISSVIGVAHTRTRCVQLVDDKLAACPSTTTTTTVALQPRGVCQPLARARRHCGQCAQWRFCVRVRVCVSLLYITRIGDDECVRARRDASSCTVCAAAAAAAQEKQRCESRRTQRRRRRRSLTATAAAAAAAAAVAAVAAAPSARARPLTSPLVRFELSWRRRRKSTG